MKIKEVEMKTLKEIVAEVKTEMRCNCDLDNWQPERDTGHSWVCRIHKESKKRFSNQITENTRN